MERKKSDQTTTPQDHNYHNATAYGGATTSKQPPFRSRVNKPWSPEEDALLEQLVVKYGARNWNLMASGIPGRSGKSCRLRWCNQLDPCLKRKPFTEEEDRIIISAHAIHGNKWCVIAKLLPGRTDNAIKNHWNSTLSKRYDLSKFTKDANMDRNRASSEDTLSGDPVSCKAPEVRSHVDQCQQSAYQAPVTAVNETRADVNMVVEQRQPSSFLAPVSENSQNVTLVGNQCPPSATQAPVSENITNFTLPPYPPPVIWVPYPPFVPHYPPPIVTQSVEATEHPSVSRPVPLVGAFNIYRPPSNPTRAELFLDSMPVEGPSVNMYSLDTEMSKILDGVKNEPIIPSRCGHGCCEISTGGGSRNSLLLGPEFVDYEEPSTFSGYELASIAKDLNNIAWIKSGLDSSSARRMETCDHRRGSQETCIRTGDSGECPENNNVRFEEGRSKLMGIVAEMISTQMPRQTVTGLS